MTAPKLLTIRESAKEAGVSEHLVRSLVKRRAVHAVYSGTRAYVNYDALCAYLCGEGANVNDM